MNVRASVSGWRALLSGGVAGLVLFGAAIVFAAAPAEPRVLTSASKQFAVRGKPQRSAFATSAKENEIYVEPAVLVAACERIRQAVAQALGWGENWRGHIFVNVHPVRFDNEWPELQALRTTDGWRYRLEIPDQVDRTRLVESIVEALLVEFADRAALEHSVELPPWLAEGLTAHLLAGSLAGLPLQPNAVSVRHSPRNDPIGPLRNSALAHGTLTFDQLNWPEFDGEQRRNDDAYHHSAHLLVRELLKLKGGPDALCATLAMLPGHLNWQSAFLRGFSPHFARLLEVEKWWALQTARLKTHDTRIVWSAAEARQKLEEVLYTPMQVRLGPDELPHVTPVALQTVLNEWGFEQQAPLLRAKLVQLNLTRLRLPPDLVPLLDSYRGVIEKYLQARSSAWFELTARNATRQAVEQLNQLDDQRLKMPVPRPAITAQAAPEESAGRADASKLK